MGKTPTLTKAFLQLGNLLIPTRRTFFNNNAEGYTKGAANMSISGNNLERSFFTANNQFLYCIDMATTMSAII
jgi:hypothetical protein